MTQFDPDIHHRHSVRLKGWNYSWIGGYWLTLCVEDRECLFGDVVGGEMHLNALGLIVVEEWTRTPSIRSQVELDQWVVMPNHLHGIIMIANRDGLPQTAFEQGAPTRLDDDTGSIRTGNGRRGDLQVALTTSREKNVDFSRPRGPARGTIGAIIAGFKGTSGKRINLARHTPGAKVWQRSFYDHVIRNEEDLEHARTYIFDNPANWESDENHPAQSTKK